MPELPIWARRQAGGLLLALHVQPGARRTGVVGEHGQRLKIALRAPPVDGKANEELVRFLASALALRRSQVQLIAGQTNRDKSIAIECAGADAVALVAQLCARPSTRG